RFLYCMILRSPEYLQRAAIVMAPYMEAALEKIRPEYARLREPNQPESFEEFRTQWLADRFNTSPHRFLHNLIDSERVITKLMEMRWWTITLNSPTHLFLTSDRPIIMTNGFGATDGHIAMPISPWDMFFATRVRSA